MSSKKNVLAIAIMFALFFMIAFVTGIQNPLGVIVKSHFELSNFQSQWGTLANFLAYLCMGIPSGMMLQKIGYKKTATFTCSEHSFPDFRCVCSIRS